MGLAEETEIGLLGLIHDHLAHLVARGAAGDEVRKVIMDQTQEPYLGFLGQAHVNVLMTNLALDKALPKAKPKA